MAISGSLNFLSASITGSTDINIDFVGLNTLLVDPVTLSDNKIGYADTVGSETYYNNSIQLIGGPKPNQLNSLLLNRNGPYNWATWQQARNSTHPVARKLRLNNTMSIDLTWPQKRNVHTLAHLNAFSYENGSRTEESDLIARIHLSTPRTEFTELKQYYEPSVDSKHKPFIYSVDITDGPFGKAIARSTLMNETSYFYNDALNDKLKIKEYSYPVSSRPRWHKQKKHFDKNFTAAKQSGAKNFLYSERIFPKGINAGLPYKLEKPNYEEVAGSGSLGYDRNPSVARSFWRNLQGGGTGYDVLSDGTTRMRTDGLGGTPPTGLLSGAINSLDQRQSLSIRTLDTTTGSHGARNLLISQSVGSVKPTWNMLQAYTDYGVISHMNNVITGGTDDFGNPDLPPYRFFVQNETYSPYPIALLSMWPLDARQDLFGGSAKTKHLSGAAGGAGSQIGLTPHRSYQNIAGTTSDVTPLSTWTDYSNGNPRDSVNLSSQRVTDLTAILTGSAGELAYSTKPTIFYFATGSRHASNFAWEGYHKPTASMQYNRHTFPYNTPFYATNLIRGKNPMFNSYAEFVGDNLKYFGRDYTVVPEFRISDHLDYYFRYFASHTIMNEGRDTYVYLNNPEQPDGSTPLKRSIFKKTLHHQFPANSTKLDFLTLDGVDITSSSGQASKGHLKDLPHTHTRYDYDQINGTTSRVYYKKERHYASEQDAVTFYEKYSHSDDLSNFTRLLDHEGGFTLGKNAVPDHIKVTCHGIKKLLPYNGFYPVLRTMQIGKAFKDVVYDLLSTSPIYDQANNIAQHDKDAALQTILEPLFAPGVLYNSIKSGIAVDYPIYFSSETTPFGATGQVPKGMPLYYTPAKFIASSSTGFGIASRTGGGNSPHMNDRISYEASSSFNYGGLHMMGSSRSIPAILNSKPTKRVPFEALYDLSKLDFLSQNGIKSLGGLHLTTDFIDLDRVDTAIWNAVYENYEGYDLNSAGKTCPYTHRTTNMIGKKRPAGQPTRVDTLFSKNNSVEQQVYHSTINNFLCESMEFFLADVDASPGVKLPVHSSGQVPTAGVEVEGDTTFYMDVSLTMGRHQVMCEGPRDASIGHAAGTTSSSDADRVVNGFTSNSTMRGYIYGPPIETVHSYASGSTIVGDAVATSGEITATGSQINIEDFESYFGANLQDPAYQAFTPPYFYGDSTMYVTFSPEGSGKADLSEMISKARQDSFNFEEYYTGSHTGDWDGLSLYVPTTASVSEGSLTRMKIEASVDIFNEPVPVHVKSNNIMQEKIADYWYIAPKWVCPVLDFSSSVSALHDRQTLEGAQNNYPFYFPVVSVTNSFHDVTTGKGLWGGYGTDPYDPILMSEVYSTAELSDDRISKMDKGIWLHVREAFTDQQTKQGQAAGYTSPLGTSISDHELEANYYMPRQNTAANWETGSLVRKIGFEPEKYEIGKFANSKMISEAVVVIPYFEEEIKIKLKDKSYAEQIGYEFDEASGKPDFPGNEIFSTREIIPGKHFLPIHKTLFDNILSVVIADEYYQPGDAQYTNTVAKGMSTGARAAHVAMAKETDVGKMITTLMGSKFTNRTGYQIPPEFDFINFANVDPFQMMIIPFEHQLNKQDLIDIYQGIMPSVSDHVEKVISSVVVNPTAQYTDMHPWMPYVFSPDSFSSKYKNYLTKTTSFSDTQSNNFGGLNVAGSPYGIIKGLESNGLVGSEEAVHKTRISLNQFNITNFLAPVPVQLNNAIKMNNIDFIPAEGVTGVQLDSTTTETIQEGTEDTFVEIPGVGEYTEPGQSEIIEVTQKYIPTLGSVPGNSKVLSEWVDQSSIPAWLSDSREFYGRMRFMVFKVKQRAKKDYKSYRQKQIARTILSKAEARTPGSDVRLGGTEFENAISRVPAREAIGANWPYDYFSLIESIKIDIDIGVAE